MKPIRIALTKGRLEKDTVALFDRIGLDTAAVKDKGRRLILPVGSGVEQGDRFAYVAGASDHCDGACIHWGLRNGNDAYLDPQARTESRKIVLKMVTES